MGEPAQRGFRQQVGAASAGRQTGQEMLQQASGRLPPDLRSPFQRVPLAVKRHPHRLRVELARRQATGSAVLAAAVVGDAAHDAPQPFRQSVVKTLVLQHLRGHAQVKRGGLVLAQVGRRLAHMPDQRDLDSAGGLQTP